MTGELFEKRTTGKFCTLLSSISATYVALLEHSISVLEKFNEESNDIPTWPSDVEAARATSKTVSIVLENIMRVEAEKRRFELEKGLWDAHRMRN